MEVDLKETYSHHFAIKCSGIENKMFFGTWEDYTILRKGLEIIGSVDCLALVNEFCDWIEPFYNKDEEDFAQAIAATEADREKLEDINSRYIDCQEDVRKMVDQYIEALLAE